MGRLVFELGDVFEPGDDMMRKRVMEREALKKTKSLRMNVCFICRMLCDSLAECNKRGWKKYD